MLHYGLGKRCRFTETGSWVSAGVGSAPKYKGVDACDIDLDPVLGNSGVALCLILCTDYLKVGTRLGSADPRLFNPVILTRAQAYIRASPELRSV